MLKDALGIPPSELAVLARALASALGAQDSRLYVADYALRRLQRVDIGGPVEAPIPIAGTLPGRAFISGKVVATHDSPTVLTVPLVDGVERIGVLQLVYDRPDTPVPESLDAIVGAFVSMLVTRGRYTDEWARARRSQPLTPAAEIQWSLLPPLSCETPAVAVSGVLEPAYDIGGDSFDYALNSGQIDLAIIDAVGKGISAVLMSTAVVNSLRFSRRGGADLATAYEQADAVMRAQFGGSAFVTGQAASLDLRSGDLTWINAGHPLPMLARNGAYAGELPCTPSTPFGLGGPLAEIAVTPLQPGDRVLFYTDGVTEAVGPAGDRFGTERLADYFIRSTLDKVDPAETARRLSAHVLEFTADRIGDDATLLLLEYRSQP